jgi:hypothetical protein
MADLVVELYGTRAGVLAGTWRTFDFLPDGAASNLLSGRAVGASGGRR